MFLEGSAAVRGIRCVSAGLLPASLRRNDKYLSVVGPTLGFSVLCSLFFFLH